ncbi:hypothetical protein [Achromobacter aloeverae]
MLLKKAVSVYGVIWVLFALYGWLFGEYSYKGFAYNLGRGLVWPVSIFPSLGPILGGIILLVVIGGILVFRKN